MARDNKVRTYNPANVILTFGSVIASGYADGTTIAIERSAESFTRKKGIDGTVERVNTNSFDFTITLTLLQTSITNDALSAIHNSDIVNADGVYPLTIRDLGGTTLFSAPSAWIQQDPNEEFADDTTNREWVFGTGPATKVTGGSTTTN